MWSTESFNIDAIRTLRCSTLLTSFGGGTPKWQKNRFDAEVLPSGLEIHTWGRHLPKTTKATETPRWTTYSSSITTRSPAASGGREKKRAKQMITSSLDHRSPTFELGPETRLRSTPTSIVPSDNASPRKHQRQASRPPIFHSPGPRPVVRLSWLHGDKLSHMCQSQQALQGCRLDRPNRASQAGNAISHLLTLEPVDSAVLHPGLDTPPEASRTTWDGRHTVSRQPVGPTTSLSNTMLRPRLVFFCETNSDFLNASRCWPSWNLRRKE